MSKTSANQSQPNVVTKVSNEYKKQDSKIAEFEHLKDELKKIKVTRPGSDVDSPERAKKNVSIKHILKNNSPGGGSRNERAKFNTVNDDLEFPIGNS